MFLYVIGACVTSDPMCNNNTSTLWQGVSDVLKLTVTIRTAGHLQHVVYLRFHYRKKHLYYVYMQRADSQNTQTCETSHPCVVLQVRESCACQPCRRNNTLGLCPTWMRDGRQILVTTHCQLWHAVNAHPPPLKLRLVSVQPYIAHTMVNIEYLTTSLCFVKQFLPKLLFTVALRSV